MTKICTICKIEQPIDNFSFLSKENNIRQFRCKQCYKEYRILNKERLKELKRIYYLNNQDFFKEKAKKQRAKPENKVKRNENEKNRRKIDVPFRLKISLQTRIQTALSNILAKKLDKFSNLLGETYLNIKKHLESQFKLGMTWENHGVDGWHIDHIIPCSAFDLTKEEEQKACFNYRNLQPLWARGPDGNLSKSGTNKVGIDYKEKKEKFIQDLKDLKII